MIDEDWCDLDLAPLPVFDSDSEANLHDDVSDTIFDCKKRSLEYSECLLYDDLHWLNDLDELDKTLEHYQNTNITKSTFTESSQSFIIYQQPCKLVGCYKYKRKKATISKRLNTNQKSIVR